MPCETGLARGLCRPGRCPTPRGVSCSTLVRHTAVSRSGQRPRQPGIWTCSLAGCSLGRGPYLELGRCRLSLFTIDRDRSEHRRLLHQGCHGVGLCDYQAGTGRGCGGLHSCRGPCLAAPSVEHPVLCQCLPVKRSTGGRATTGTLAGKAHDWDRQTDRIRMLCIVAGERCRACQDS